MRHISFIFACNLIKEIYRVATTKRRAGKRRAEKYFAHLERLKDLMKKLNHFGYHNFFKTYVLNIKANKC